MIALQRSGSRLSADLQPTRTALNIAFEREPIEQRCRPISCPVLVIYGTNDPYMGPEFATPPRDWVPNARVKTIAGANHRVQMDKPERVTELLESFLSAGRAP